MIGLHRYLVALAFAWGAGGDATARIAAEIERWTKSLRAPPGADESWLQLESGSEAALARAAEAVRNDHPWLALQRLAGVAINLGAAEYLAQRPAVERTDLAAFDAEWRRMEQELGDVVGSAAPALDDVRPAAARALGEIAWMQARAFLAASRDYAASTEPKFGLFYVGQAVAARDFVTLCRELSTPAAEPAPPLRPLEDEIDALERDLLQAYRPPRSLLLHSEFIASSSLLNEARELDRAGLRAGALLRLLQAALQSAPLRTKPESPSPDPLPEPLTDRLRACEATLAKTAADGSIGRIFLDSAEEALAATPPNEATARTLLDDVLPRCFRACAPASPASPASLSPPAPRAQTTLTLVRWPFT